jgi:hypothetical protein
MTLRIQELCRDVRPWEGVFHQQALVHSAVTMGDPQRATALARDMLEQADRLGGRTLHAYALFQNETLGITFNATDVSTAGAREMLEYVVQRGRKAPLPYVLDALGVVASRSGRPEAALCLFGAAHHLGRNRGLGLGRRFGSTNASTGQPSVRSFSTVLAETLESTRVTLGPGKADQAWEEGLLMNPDQAAAAAFEFIEALRG